MYFTLFSLSLCDLCVLCVSAVLPGLVSLEVRDGR
jgi:hypothetical protein